MPTGRLYRRIQQHKRGKRRRKVAGAGSFRKGKLVRQRIPWWKRWWQE